MPRVNQLLNWVMGINFLCGVVFLLTIVYEYGFSLPASSYEVVHTVYHTIWILFCVLPRCRLCSVRKTRRLSSRPGPGFLPFCST